jgi:hypothetical protein
MAEPDVGAEEFAGIARRAGFRFSPEEAERMRGAYGALRRLLARLPDIEAAAEPAVIFAPEGTALKR